MIIAEHESRLKSLLEQKKRLIFAVGFLCLIVFFQTFTIMMIGKKQDRVLISPPVITESFWLDSNTVSESYLRQIGDYFIKTAMTVTPNTVESQYQYILNNVYPEYFGDVKGQLLRRGNDVKNKGISTVFISKSYDIDMQTLTVNVRGDLIVITGRNRTDPMPKHFAAQFIYEHDRLYLKEINEVVS